MARPPKKEDTILYDKDAVRENILRITRNSSQKALAALLGRTESNISKKMNGTNSWSVSDLIKLSSTYGVSIDSILGIEKDRPCTDESPTVKACRLVDDFCSLTGYRCDVQILQDMPGLSGSPVDVRNIVCGPDKKQREQAPDLDLDLLSRFLASYNATSWSGLLTGADVKRKYIDLLLDEVTKILQYKDDKQ